MKAQISGQVIVFVLAVFLFASILLFGIKTMYNTQETVDEVQLIALMNKISSSIEKIGPSYGAMKRVELKAPNNLLEICFVDYEAFLGAKKEERLEALTKKSPRIAGEVEGNLEGYKGAPTIFTIPSIDTPFITKNIEVESGKYACPGMEFSDDGFLCIPIENHKIDLRLEGKGKETWICPWDSGEPKPAHSTQPTIIEKDLCGGSKTQIIPINFPATHTQCKWGINGNLEKKNKHMQARNKQTIPIHFDKSKTLCAVHLQFKEDKSIKYDDKLFLTFNDWILLSNDDLHNFFDTEYFYKFDWEKIKGINRDTSMHKPYCAGECQIPQSDTYGNIWLKLDKVTSQELSNIIRDDNKQEFSLIIIGDDDVSDCQHEGMNFDLELSYLE